MHYRSPRNLARRPNRRLPQRYSDSCDTAPVGDGLSVMLSGLRPNASAGTRVDEKTALSVMAYYAAVRLIAETEATLPFPVYKRLSGGGKDRERDHPVYDLLNVSPDGYLTAMQWREAKLGHVLAYGNGYSEIERTNGGEPKALHLIPPNKVKPERLETGEVIYKVDGKNGKDVIPAENMLHWAGLGFNGLVGYSPVKLAKEALGLCLATEQFGSSWFGNGSRGAGVITHPGELSPTAIRNIRDSVDEVHGGPEKFGKWMIFGEGVKVEQIGIPPEDAQFLETRKFQISEIARLMRVPPHMIGDLSAATFSNIEQQSLDFVIHTVRPWCVRIEAQTNLKLFGEDERKTYFAEHVVDGLLRGDTPSRYAAYAIGRNWGWLNADMICEMENMNPLPNGIGKIFLVPTNMMNAEDLLAPPEPPPAPVAVVPPGSEPATDGTPGTEAPPAPGDAAQPPADPSAGEGGNVALAAVTEAAEETFGRMVRREAQAVRRASKKPAEFLRFLDEFYEDHRTMLGQATAPGLRAVYALHGITDAADACLLIERTASTVAEAHRGELLDLSGRVSADELPEAVDALLEGWERDRPREILAGVSNYLHAQGRTLRLPGQS